MFHNSHLASLQQEVVLDAQLRMIEESYILVVPLYVPQDVASNPASWALTKQLCHRHDCEQSASSQVWLQNRWSMWLSFKLSLPNLAQVPKAWCCTQCQTAKT
jgi:hypothetical protein